MSKHTAGVWFIAEPDELSPGLHIKTKELGYEYFIAEVIGGLPEQSANASLICAAPKMLAVLNRISADTTWRSNDNELWRLICDVCAEARGDK